MTKQVKFFDIQPYKINKLYSELAKKLYKQICYKYNFLYQDINIRTNLLFNLTCGTKINEKFLFGLLFAIIINHHAKIHTKYIFFLLR